MKITQYEQSGFVFTTNNGYTLAIDIGAYTPLEKIQNLSIDAMIVSHLHKDHFSQEHIDALNPSKLYLNQECISLFKNTKTEVTQISAGDTVQIEGITVSVFTVDHGNNVNVIPKENLGFLITADDVTIYFAGDMFYPSGIDVSNLSVDYACIPVGTFYTFGPQKALTFIKHFKSIGTVIPMHFHKTPETKNEFTLLAQEAGYTVFTH